MLFEDDDHWESHRQNYLPTLEIKDYNVMIDGKYFLDQPIKNDLKTYENIRKISRRQVDDYTTGCLLDYSYFKKYYKLIAIDLRKQEKLDADPKVIQQIRYSRSRCRRFYLEAKETFLDFSEETVQVLRFHFVLI